MSADPAFAYHDLFPLGADATPYRKLTNEGVRVEKLGGREIVVVDREAIRLLAEQAFVDINHLLRPGHLNQLRTILEDPEGRHVREITLGYTFYQIDLPEEPKSQAALDLAPAAGGPLTADADASIE